MQSAISPGPVCIQDPEACREDYGRPLPPWTQTSWTLPSSRRLRSIRTKTSRHQSSFFPSAVGLINKARDPRPPTQTLIPTATTHYIDVKSPHLAQCVTLPHIFLAYYLC